MPKDMEILLQPRVAAVEPTGKNSFLKSVHICKMFCAML